MGDSEKTLLGAFPASCVFNGQNWEAWQGAFVGLAYAQGSLACIQGKRPRASDLEAALQWETANKRIQPLLIRSIEAPILASAPPEFRYDAHALLLWLARTYKPQSSDARALLFRALLEVQQEEGETVSAFERRWREAHTRCVSAGVIMDAATLAYLVHFAASSRLSTHVRMSDDDDGKLGSDHNFANMFGDEIIKPPSVHVSTSATATTGSSLTVDVVFARLRTQERMAEGI
jgi:hypothetical protein